MTRRYANPPVVEALCEIYTTGSAWDLTIPGLFYEKVRDRFPKRGQARDVVIEATVGAPELAARLIPGEPRTQFSSEDGSRMIQVARDLVVVNQLRPYPAFEEWEPRIPEALGFYRDLAKPVAIQRAGLRYINRVVIPAPTGEVAMERYFRLYPQLPDTLGPAHGSFLLRIDIATETSGHRLLVTFGTAPPQREGTLAFLLDLYETGSEMNFEALPGWIERAHANIERTFEAILTDATRNLFGEDSRAG